MTLPENCRLLYQEKVPGDFQPYIEFYPLKNCRKAAGGVLIFPGGGYMMRAEHEGMPVAKKFNELGFHAFVLQYRVNPATFPAPQQDGFAALKMLRSMSSELNLNPYQLAVCGFSAGGHLTACMGTLYNELATEAERPDALIMSYAVVSLGDDFGHAGSGRMLLGEDGCTPENISKYSLHNRITPETPPAFLWHTADDPVVPVRNAYEFALHLRENNVAHEVHVFPHGPHGMGLAEDDAVVSRWPHLAADFLEKCCAFDREC